MHKDLSARAGHARLCREGSRRLSDFGRRALGRALIGQCSAARPSVRVHYGRYRSETESLADAALRPFVPEGTTQRRYGRYRGPTYAEVRQRLRLRHLQQRRPADA